MLIYLVFQGLLYPFLGTVLGSLFVFFLKKQPDRRFMIILDSFAAGIMCAASFFSLIAPATERASEDGKGALAVCCLGFFLGIILFIPVDNLMNHFFSKEEADSGRLLLVAVSVHNIPEGMAVGVVYAGILYGQDSINIAAALALSIGIAIQNIPEGAIISLPLKARGKGSFNAFLSGLLSGVAELTAGVFTLFISSVVSSVLPLSLCFAAGTMFYVVMNELSAGFQDSRYAKLSSGVFATGFCVMMLLDTLFG